MAHVIARSPKGQRGISSGGQDTYDNLILLCPTDHTRIDKAPVDTFPPELLRDWKRRHEEYVTNAYSSPVFSTFNELQNYIGILLIENKSVWETYGPESIEAHANPASNSSSFWVVRKLNTIIPNNRKIIVAIRANAKIFDVTAYAAASRFIEHAEGFERNCFERTEGVPKFPTSFAEVIYGSNAV